MKYRVTCLTPTLVGDGQRLSPIDYMVWKDQVNVLDQSRIFRLLARGPRLESYLAQLKKSEKLDFASWGGFAQNYAGRRIAFEHPSSTPVWERTRAEHLFIPTFAAGLRGPYLPASALKGSLRTAVIGARAGVEALTEAVSKLGPEGRGMRYVAASVEEDAIGSGPYDTMRLVKVGDSAPAPLSAFKVYLLRVSTLDSRGSGKFEVAWKQAPRGSSKRADDATPLFAEMAVPGTVFEGDWASNGFLSRPEIARALRMKDRRPDAKALFEAANTHANVLLEIQRTYAELAGLPNVLAGIESLQHKLEEIRASDDRCLLSLGWSAGILSKTAFLDTRADSYRTALRQIPFYARAIQSNLPFPKTRRIVFLENQPAALSGFVELAIAG